MASGWLCVDHKSSGYRGESKATEQQMTGFYPDLSLYAVQFVAAQSRMWACKTPGWALKCWTYKAGCARNGMMRLSAHATGWCP